MVDMAQELVEQAIGTFQLADVVCGQERGQASLPEVVTAFDFALGLRGGRKAQGDAVEMQSGPQLGEGLGRVGEEERMIVHIKGQRQAVSEEGARQEIEVSREGFAVVETSACIVTGGGVEDFKEGLLVGAPGSQAWGLASYGQSAP